MARTVKYLTTPEIRFTTIAAGEAILNADSADEVEVLLDIKLVTDEPDLDRRHDA